MGTGNDRSARGGGGFRFRVRSVLKRAGMVTLAVLLATTTFVGLSDPADAAARDVTTFAGSGTSGHLAVDPGGNVYVADQDNHVIRKITPTGEVSTLAGDPGVPGYRDSASGPPQFALPSDVAIDAAGNVIVADWSNHVVRKITSSGYVTTVAGQPGNPGYQNGAAAVAQFASPSALAIDSAGAIFVAEYDNGVIRRIDPAGSDVTLFAGTPTIWGHNDGTAFSAKFKQLVGLTFDPSGNLFAVESSGTVRKIDPSGLVSTVAGAPDQAGYANGNGTAARFYVPTGIASDSLGNLYVADQAAHRIRRIETASAPAVSEVSTFAGSSAGFVNGLPLGSKFSSPTGVAMNPIDGALVVVDQGNHSVRRILGHVSTLSGSGVEGSLDGEFSTPVGLAVDSAGNTYVAET
jgi:streptogramin lyase